MTNANEYLDSGTDRLLADIGINTAKIATMAETHFGQAFFDLFADNDDFVVIDGHYLADGAVYHVIYKDGIKYDFIVRRHKDVIDACEPCGVDYCDHCPFALERNHMEANNG
jgi:hypothetical protein